MARNLYRANRQWADRPADQRFWAVEDALKATKAYADKAQEVDLDFAAPKLALTDGDNIGLEVGGQALTLTNWAYTQLCRMGDAPGHYLRTLPAELAADCLQVGLDRFFGDRAAEDRTRRVLHQGGEVPVVRSITSERYARFWNHEVFARLADLQADGWKVPPARPSPKSGPDTRRATKEDVLRARQGGGGIAVREGDLIAPAGVYASDRDMFCFMVNEDVRIDDGSDGGLSRGFFISNSEVGDGSLRVTTFGYRNVCGNHIVWGAEDVIEVSVRHIGSVGGRFEVTLREQVGEYLKASAKEEQARVRRAKARVLGATDAEVLDAVVKAFMGGRRFNLPQGLSMKQIKAAQVIACENADTDGNPRSVWGMVNGLTRLSQQTPYMNERNQLDRAAAQVLALAA